MNFFETFSASCKNCQKVLKGGEYANSEYKQIYLNCLNKEITIMLSGKQDNLQFRWQR